ncbi:MAG: DMT family transporter [Rhodospirillales bacterium]|nr:DMT family transporter [Rhodospirillales bacterium]
MTAKVPPPPAPTMPPAAIATGILLMVVAVGCFAATNMCVKLIGTDYHPVEAVFFRNLITAVLTVPFILSFGGLRILKTKRAGIHAIRTVTGVLSNACYFYAYQHVALADGMAIAMSVPIFATLFAIPLLGERVGLHRWLAIVVGFCGVLIALNPQGDIQTGSLYALAGTLFWAVALPYVRMLGATESPYTVVFHYMWASTLMTACVLPFVWVTPTTEVMILYLATGLAGTIGQICMTYALKLAPASIISPFEYTKIGWAILFDLTLWGASPSVTTLLGAGIVMVTGLYILYRETRHRK